MGFTRQHSSKLPPNQGRVLGAEGGRAASPDSGHPLLKDVSQNSHSLHRRLEGFMGSVCLAFEDKVFTRPYFISLYRNSHSCSTSLARHHGASQGGRSQELRQEKGWGPTAEGCDGLPQCQVNWAQSSLTWKPTSCGLCSHLGFTYSVHSTDASYPAVLMRGWAAFDPGYIRCMGPCEGHTA